MSNFVEKELDKKIALNNEKNKEIEEILLLGENTNNENREFLKKIGMDRGLKIASGKKHEIDAKNFYLDKGFKIINFEEFIEFIEVLRIHSNIQICRSDYFKGTIKEKDILKLKELDGIEDLRFNKLYVIHPKDQNNISQDKYILIYVSHKNSNPAFLDEDNNYIIPIISEKTFKFSRFKISNFYIWSVPIMFLLSLFLPSVLYNVFIILYTWYILWWMKDYSKNNPSSWDSSHDLNKYYYKSNLYKN